MAPDIHLVSAIGAWSQRGTLAQGQRNKPARIPRLRSLVLAIQSGPVDAARLAFTELTAQDHELAQHPVITRIGAALQSSQLREACRIAQELRVPFPLAFATPGTAPALSTPPRGFFAGFAAGHLDLSA